MLVLTRARSGLGCHADIAVVGQDDNGLGVHARNGLEKVGGGGIHGLTTGDDDVDPKRLEDLGLTGTSGNGHKAKRLGRLGGSLLVGVNLGGALGDLKVHVVDEHLVDLTELKHVLEHQVGGVGVNVNLVVGIRTDEQLAIAHGTEELQGLVLVKGLLGLKEELVAVTELGALPVVVRLDLNAVERAGLGGVGVGLEGGGEVLDLGGAAEGGGHKILEEDGKAEGARIDDAVLLKDRQQVGRAGDRLICLDHKGVQRLLNAHTALLALVGLGGHIAQDGQDGALDGLADRLEGDLDGSTERGGDIGGGDGLPGLAQALGHRI